MTKSTESPSNDRTLIFNLKREVTEIDVALLLRDTIKKINKLELEYLIAVYQILKKLQYCTSLNDLKPLVSIFRDEEVVLKQSNSKQSKVKQSK